MPGDARAFGWCELKPCWEPQLLVLSNSKDGFDIIVIGVGFDPFERDKKIEENRKKRKKNAPLKGIKSLLRLEGHIREHDMGECLI